MSLWKHIVLYCVFTTAWCAEQLNFPQGFQFGVASAAYQVEGAWNISDKGESIWDRYTHSSRNIPDQANGDVACDSYHLWRRDLEMLDELGVDFYRFSISWTRILPNGFSNQISKEGAKYYSDLIDGLLEKGIEPVVTLYHWDLPQRLQVLGGWTNPLISDWFASYVSIVFSLYADRVKTWITINEPIIICQVAYAGIVAPAVNSLEGSMLCSKNVLLAHAKAWRIYDEEYRKKYQGRVSLVNYVPWVEPATKADEDVADLVRQQFNGLYSHPVFTKDGGWPPSYAKSIADYSKKLGYPKSILPVLSKNETDLIKGTYDFYGLNFYTSYLARRVNESDKLMMWPKGTDTIFGAKLMNDPSWEPTAASFYIINPEGLRKQLYWLKQAYGDIPFIIMENGLAHRGAIDDGEQINFYKSHLQQVLLSIKQDGVNVTGFSAWSLMDSFEWHSGYKLKFGLYQVDFTSPERKRTPRASAHYYTRVIKARSLDVDESFRTTLQTEESSANGTSTSTYVLVAGGVVVSIIIIAVIYQVRKKRNVSRRNSYNGVPTDDSLKIRDP